jgi:hypothetical protein
VTAKKPVKFKFPRKLADCADYIYDLKQRRLALQKDVAALEAEEKALRAHLIEKLPLQNASSIAGISARVSLEPRTVPTVGDWDAVFRFIKKTGKFELLQRRLSDAVVKELWDDGKKVPGVGQLEITVLSINKV